MNIIEEKDVKLKKWNETHKNINGTDHKLCSICDLWLPCNGDYYYKNKCNSIDGFHPYCKECGRAKARKWNKDHPEKHLEHVLKDQLKPERQEGIRLSNRKWRAKNQKEWQHNNKDKLKLYRLKREMHKAHEITKQEWQSCKEYFNNSCAYCGLPEEDHKKMYNQQLHKEHVINDGRNDLKNCVPSCRECNSNKSTHSFNNWYRNNNQRYSYDRYLKIYQWLRYDYKKYIQKKKPKRNSL